MKCLFKCFTRLLNLLCQSKGTEVPSLPAPGRSLFLLWSWRTLPLDPGRWALAFQGLEHAAPQCMVSSGLHAFRRRIQVLWLIFLLINNV